MRTVPSPKDGNGVLAQIFRPGGLVAQADGVTRRVWLGREGRASNFKFMPIRNQKNLEIPDARP